MIAHRLLDESVRRARLGVNYKQIPVNTPRVEVHSYSKDGAMRIRNVTDPVYAPNSVDGAQADPAQAAEVHWAADGEMVRAAYTLRQDDDFGQPGSLVREVLDDEARQRLAHNVIGYVCKGVREPVLSRVSSTGRTWTPISARRSRKAYAPTSKATTLSRRKGADTTSSIDCARFPNRRRSRKQFRSALRRQHLSSGLDTATHRHPAERQCRELAGLLGAQRTI